MEPRDEASNNEWLERLRQRFVNVARRRVSEADVEDVVQDAMGVVLEKGIDRGAGAVGDLPPLAWCFQVLRNTIGNHYRRERTRRRWVTPDTEGIDRETSTAERPFEALGTDEALRAIEEAIDDVSRESPNCGRYLSRLLDDARPNDVAEEEGLEPSVFYRRLYRCRQKLRLRLQERGIVT
jgi:RNA polymerase sigma factor (sigma-70 family)